MIDGIMNDLLKADGGAGNAGIDPAAELTAPMVKRGRGRPRKVHKFDEDPEDGSQMPTKMKNEKDGEEEDEEPAIIIDSGKSVYPMMMNISPMFDNVC